MTNNVAIVTAACCSLWKVTLNGCTPILKKLTVTEGIRLLSSWKVAFSLLQIKTGCFSEVMLYSAQGFGLLGKAQWPVFCEEVD